MKLTQEEKRIKLANYAGWHERPEPHGSQNATAWWHNKDRYPSYLMPVPDYVSDLNAVHELEKSLSDGQYDIFEQELARVAGFICHDEWPAPSVLRKVISATAAQRAEALGLTLKLW
jgi:hypothetical protein